MCVNCIAGFLLAAPVVTLLVSNYFIKKKGGGAVNKFKTKKQLFDEGLLEKEKNKPNLGRSLVQNSSVESKPLTKLNNTSSKKSKRVKKKRLKN